ncbi:DUF4226 domain-containing protein [Mycobacterium malmoense]|uniref:DUF4226 domain-containing protein n=1 Tax=Mycobacterium malmoense TaxID=1780 RepID=A0ABX3SX26_MYCMA|nr:DUF4226 domain-containing protein [Mycobacterium malmoense]ORA85168.1 hypothetical protein BST29_03005 [Mycobacterium malmoense]QZA18488.1 DUF4226 domain-containing protein [Mycobacterium malmoense]UNB95259.1 DUF4226 domain-containing protein [Mycobacterium malmoense]
MSEETGLGAGAARARETVLAESVRVPGAADRMVVPTLRAAYGSVLRGRWQLDAIGADIESAVANQRALALDTPAGAVTFAKFLAAKAQDINRVVTETAEGSRGGAATLGSLGPSYQALGYGPKPQEPPPAPVPFPPYQPKVWGACRARGQDPDKVVRTFYHASISARFRSLPAGDSVLYCGNDKYGLLHIEKEHEDQWDRIANSRWPSAGNWRYLADYAIGATLAYPERVEYNQDNDTFAVYRRISLPDGRYAFTTRVVISANDGKIITAFPQTSA